MSSTYQPTGLRLVGTAANGPYEGGVTAYPLTTNNTAKLAVGDIVALVAGSIAPIAAAPVSGTLSANTPVGVIVGFKYTDPINPGRALVTSQILAANAISNLGYVNVVVYVADGVGERFTVQANGPVVAADLGGTIAPAGFGAADLLTRTSRVYADVATIDVSSTSTKALRIVGFDKDVANSAGDSYTKLIVSWNRAVHYFDQAGAH